MENDRGIGTERHIVAGFTLSFLIMVLLIVNGFLTAIKVSILKGDEIEDIFENTGFYHTIRVLAVDEIYENSKDLGLSREIIEDIVPGDEAMSEVVGRVAEAVKNDEAVDFSYLKGDCMDAAKSAGGIALEQIFKEVDSSSGQFDVRILTQNEEILKFEREYGIEDLTKIIENEVQREFGSTVVDLSVVDKELIKSKLSDIVNGEVYPVVEELFDRYIERINYAANDAIREMDEIYFLRKMIWEMDRGLVYLFYAVVIIYVIAVVLFFVQLFIYRRQQSKAFRNLAICMGVSGMLMLMVAMFIKLVSGIAINAIKYEGSSKELIKDFVEHNLQALNNKIIAVGAIYIIIFAVSILVAILLGRGKKKAAYTEW